MGRERAYEMGRSAAARRRARVARRLCLGISGRSVVIALIEAAALALVIAEIPFVLIVLQELLR
jgi:hypothetical protein